MPDSSQQEKKEGTNDRAVGDWATHAALLVVQVAFASQAVESKIAMLPRGEGGEAIAPEALAMFRMIGGALFFQLFLWATGQSKRTTLRDHAHLAILSVLGIALNQALFLAGLRLTTPFAVALLGAAIPVFTAALAVLFRHEAFRLRMGLGLVLALAGVLWLTGVGTLDRGAVLVAINSLCYSAYLVFSRKVIVRLGALTVVGWIFTWGALLFLPVGGGALLAALPVLSPRGIGYVAYIVAVPTIVAYFANAWALGRSTASLVTIYIYLQPLLTALIAWVQLGQGVTLRMLGAGALILLGVTVAAARKTRAG